MAKIKGRTKAKARKKTRQQKKLSAAAYKKNILLKILKYDNDILAQKCFEVNDKTDVSKTIATMKKVLGNTDNGVGLAASQIGILDRIVVIRPDANKYKMIAMINPEIISNSEEKKYGIEGCLSYPKTFSPIERFVSVTVQYFDEDWEEQNVEFKEGEIEGIIVQHEIEHLDEGHCQIHDWWEDKEWKQKELQEIFAEKSGKGEKKSKYDVVESEDMKREKEEAEMSD